MSKDKGLPIHWQFAAINAFRALESQVREFSFARDANGQLSSVLKPTEYIEIIDGFLSEGPMNLPGGTRCDLKELRQFLVHHVVAAFHVGWHTALDLCNHSQMNFESLPTANLHAMARDKSPFSGVKQEWFMEGFCQCWAQHTEFKTLCNSQSPKTS